MKYATKIMVMACLVLIGAMYFSASLAATQITTQNINGQLCYSLSSNLSKGNIGQEVAILQAMLKRENLLILPQPTMYFGRLTFAAVVAFQEKYASEILAPLGLVRGTGYVGAATRAKLNELNRCTVFLPPIAGPGQHCGGNIMNAPVCQNGYYCRPTPGVMLPFGDVGGTCIINPASNQPPVINGVSGPATLQVGQMGTWTINASDPQGGTLNYSVIWGDEVMNFPMMSNGSGATYTQTATFTHAYTATRIYTPTFYVKNAAGSIASSSISVNVGSFNTTAPVIYYLQPNSGVVGRSVTVAGSGFTSTGNRITFGNLGVENSPSYNLNSFNGTTITFTVPSTNYLACWAQGCMAPVFMTQPGNYSVSVTNANGTSNQLIFTVTSSMACTPNWQCGWGACNNGYQSMMAIDSNNCGISYQGSPPIACPLLARACTP